MIKPLISYFSLLRIKGVFFSRTSCRWRLAALVLALGLFGLPGLSTPVDVKTVLADDDGPGGDDDGDDGGGGGGFGGGDDDDDDRGSARTSRTQGSKFFSSGGSRNKAVKKSSTKKPAKKPAAKKKPRPVIVVLDLPDSAIARLRRQGFAILSDNRLASTGIRVQRMRIPPSMSLARANAIVKRLGASTSDVNSYYTTQTLQGCERASDCDYRHLAGWSMDVTGACMASPRIGLVETHLELEHPALLGQKIEIIDVKPPEKPRSGSSHGTGIAALLVGARESSAPGLLPGAELIVATPFYRAGNADRAEAADIIRAIDAVVARQPDVLSLSLAGPPNAALARVLETVRARGIPVVAAAGNGGAKSKPLYPAAYDTTIAVTAVTAKLNIFRRASRGEHVDFAAPGVEIAVADGKSGLTKRSGTSFAVPFVTASLAVLRERQPARTIDDMVAELAASAKDLGKPGKDSTFGWGLADASRLCAGPAEQLLLPVSR
jgi:hypothetical protein